MVTRVDEVFFADRARGRASGEQRSRRRAAALATHLGIDLQRLRDAHPATIIVTGSKGKGTAAAYASAVLSASGLRTGTLTSPGLRSNRERIRVDGHAIDDDAYRALVVRVAAGIEAAFPSLPTGGYLSPTGLFTLAAVRHFLDVGCDAWVLEAGMGGASDEVSLFSADVLALTQVFGEHLGVIAGDVGGIARDKLGAASAATTVIVTEPQRRRAVRGVISAAEHPVSTVRRSPLRSVSWPPALGRRNAFVGVASALALLRHNGVAPVTDAVHDTLDSIRLPGRLSLHSLGEQRWLVDAAANPVAVRAALRWCRTAAGEPSTVLLCVPDGKDVQGVRRALSQVPYTPLRVDAPHLGFSSWSRALPSLRDIDNGALGDTVLALGTVSFVGEVLTLLGVDTETLYEVNVR